MSHDRYRFDTVIARLAADSSTGFGGPGVRVEPVRRIEGPFSSVQQVRIHAPGGTTSAYIKVVRPRSTAEDVARADRMLAREYRATKALHEALLADAALGAVRPIAWIPELRTIVTAEAPGRPLAEVLRDSAVPEDRLAAIAGNLGKWIRVYQGLGTQETSISLAERRSYLDDRLAQIEGRVLSAAERRAALDEFDRLAADIGVPQVAGVPIHADLTPLNVLVDDNDRTTVIDFTMAKVGTIYHDLAHLYLHLELHARRHGMAPGVLAEMEHRLMRGFSPDASIDDPLFRLMHLQHVVCHVTFMAERHLPVVDLAYRWYLRRRWRQCRRSRAAVGAHAPAPATLRAG